jgi:hypothetical protein
MESSVFEQAVFRITGDCGLLVEYGDAIDPAVNQKVRSMASVLQDHMPAGVIETVPTYRSILIYYNPLITNPSILKATLTDWENSLAQIEIPPPKVVDIPVCYGGAYGPDIAHVAQSHHLTVQEVIDLHSETGISDLHGRLHPGFPLPWRASRGASHATAQYPANARPERIRGYCQRADGNISHCQSRRLAVDRQDTHHVVCPRAFKPFSLPGRRLHPVQTHITR